MERGFFGIPLVRIVELQQPLIHIAPVTGTGVTGTGVTAQQCKKPAQATHHISFVQWHHSRCLLSLRLSQ